MSEEDFDLQKAIGLADAAKLMRGRGGRHPAVDTVRRWASPKRGWHAPDGTQVVLYTVRYNGELLTMPGWVAEFEKARVRLGTRQPSVENLPRPAGQKRRGHEEAERRLDEGGVGRRG